METLYIRLNEETRLALLAANKDKGAVNALNELRNEYELLNLTLKACFKIVLYSGQETDKHFIVNLTNQFKNI